MNRDIILTEEVKKYMEEVNNNYFQAKKYYQAIINTQNTYQQMALLNELYSFIKSIATFYYQDLNDYMDIKSLVLDSEKAINQEFIIDTTPHYKYKKKRIAPKFLLKDEEYMVKYLVNKTRDKLYVNSLDIANLNLQGKCFKAAERVLSLSALNKVKATSYVIRPGYIKNASICDYMAEHAFVILNLNGNKYLVDPTYSQFFYLSTSSLNRKGVLDFMGTNVGTYMLMSEERKKIAQKILKDGYIKLTPNVLKYYLDGFTNFYRNGTYYEETNDFSYEPTYQDSDYMAFLEGKDNQLNHEKEKYLAYQKLPLKNPTLDFHKR